MARCLASSALELRQVFIVCSRRRCRCRSRMRSTVAFLGRLATCTACPPIEHLVALSVHCQNQNASSWFLKSGTSYDTKQNGPTTFSTARTQSLRDCWARAGSILAVSTWDQTFSSYASVNSTGSTCTPVTTDAHAPDPRAFVHRLKCTNTGRKTSG